VLAFDYIIIFLFQQQNDVYDGDDLIYSGSGCYDDEDRCSSYTDTGSGDDLITPVYIPSKPSTSTPLEKVCDEDNTDCLNKNRLPSENVFSEDKISFNSYSNPKSDPVWTQSNYIEAISHTLPPTDDYEVRVTLPSRVLPGPVYQTTRKIIPLRPTGIPSVNYVPPPQGPLKIRKKEQPPPLVTHKSSADKTAMIIGLVAIMLIVIVIITPLVLFIKFKMGIAYKSDSNNFRFIPKSSTPPLLTSPSHQSQLNGALVKTLPREKSIKLGKKNDLKEWYV
jgi:PREDICTED: similar to neurexin